MSGLAILCPGQGKQTPSLFEPLLPFPEAQKLLAGIQSAGLLSDTLLAWIKGEPDDPNLIHRNDIAQPAICLYQAMVWSVLKPLLPSPDLYLGYSLGELSAYGCAAVFTAEEWIRLAALRGRCMTAAAVIPQTMAAVKGLSKKQVERTCERFDGVIAISVDQDHFVVGLPLDKADPFLSECEKNGATRVLRLPVSVAAHTPFMKKAAEDFTAILSDIVFKPPAGDILSGVSGERVFSPEQMAHALSSQIHQTIEWKHCLENAVSRRCRVFLELGPGGNLSRMLLDSFPEVEARSISEFHDIKAIPRWVQSALNR